MVRRVVFGEPYLLEDGFGRRLKNDLGTHTETLALLPALANQPGFERAIRSRASRYKDLDIRSFAPVRRIERSGASLYIVSELPDGVRLSDLLAHLESSGEVVPESAMFELASLVINAIASLHAWPGGFAHGAINPAHILLTNDCRVVLTDCVFGEALEVLQRNREALWKDFRLAMPPAANLARFDQQTDVTQMGAVVLALILRRPVRAQEYPRAIPDLVMTTITDSASTPASTGPTGGLRTWLQQALQIHPRLAFRSAVEAQRSFTDIGAPETRPAGAQALQVLMRTACAEPVAVSTSNRTT